MERRIFSNWPTNEQHQGTQQGNPFKRSIPYSLTFICVKLNMVSTLTKICGLFCFQTQNGSGPKKATEIKESERMD